MGRTRTLLLVEAALTIALAAVLGMFKLWEMPQGGSVSLGMLPIIVFALRRGMGWGLGAGLAYGALDVLISPFAPVHPVQFLLDYPVAWAAVGFAGVASGVLAHAGRSKVRASLAILLGATVAAIARYASHVVSGIVFFGMYAPEGQPVVVYSLIYNSFVLVSASACTAIALVLVPVLERVVPSARPEEVAER